LLGDDDADVRVDAHRGLLRLTHANIGTEVDWRAGTQATRSDLVREWQQWWKDNQASIPGPKPTPPEARTKA